MKTFLKSAVLLFIALQMSFSTFAFNIPVHQTVPLGNGCYAIISGDIDVTGTGPQYTAPYESHGCLTVTYSSGCCCGVAGITYDIVWSSSTGANGATQADQAKLNANPNAKVKIEEYLRSISHP